VSDARPDPDPQEPSRFWRTLRRVLIVLLLLGAAFFGGALVTAGWGIFRGLTSTEDRTVVRPRPSVVLAVRELSRLETVTFHMERVVDIEDEQTFLGGRLKARDALLLVAAGDVTAGIDLAQLGEDDVEANTETGRITITLPPPEVLSTRIDNERTYVYSRETDVLARRKEDLESRARAEAESRLRDAALEAGILGRAQKGARRTIETLLRGLGYDDVDVRFRPR